MKVRISTVISALLLMIFLAIPVSAADDQSTAGQVKLSSGTLNVRSSPSTSSSVLTRLGNGSHVTLMSKSGQWWRVEYADGSYGYCHADYIAALSSSVAWVQVSSSLNVRSGAGTSYSRVGSLYSGETVLVLSQSGSWSKILYDGTKTGWVSSPYLATGNTGTVRLSVPRYLQDDSRWANVTLGSSGKTMAKIGCATTGIAMMESYRSGSTITPAAMAKKLKYTSSGSVYWPSDYTAVTSSSGYLSKILTLLRSGKPGRVGATNSYGGQHWVVITGFSGGSITAANFTIHDPGTASRTTLAQFLSAYPNFYKYFHY